MPGRISNARSRGDTLPCNNDQCGWAFCILFDKFQITQAFNNLIKNAIEAVSKIHNPSIKIHYFQQNNKIICLIIDNGIGVDNKKVRKLFEPYYTTKDKGTGLGLSIVKKIIEDHKGTINIEKNLEIAGSKAVVVFNTKWSLKF